MSMACVFVWEFGLPSIEIWVDCVRINAVVWAKVGMVETVGIRQVIWFIMLESAKDRIIGVDALGQHVPPCVQYGTTCWLIRETLMSCFVGCAVLVWRYLRGHTVQEGPEDIVWYPTRKNFSNCERVLRVLCDIQQGETLATVKGSWGYCVISNKGKP
jgi:hypothetical protein